MSIHVTKSPCGSCKHLIQDNQDKLNGTFTCTKHQSAGHLKFVLSYWADRCTEYASASQTEMELEECHTWLLHNVSGRPIPSREVH